MLLVEVVEKYENGSIPADPADLRGELSPGLSAAAISVLPLFTFRYAATAAGRFFLLSLLSKKRTEKGG